MEKILSLQALVADAEPSFGGDSDTSITCTGCSCNSDVCCPTQVL
jgi:hypothetical protein